MLVDITERLERGGPLTGGELAERTRFDVLGLWHSCRVSGIVRFASAGNRFLRLDRAVPGYARLSPSIRREFLTYTVLGLDPQLSEIQARARSLRQEIRDISRTKRELAREAMTTVLDGLPGNELFREHACFVIAGDIAYDMSHTVPRPERSTGQMVRGSDLDIVVIADEKIGFEEREALDRAIHKRKHYLLVHPEYREEIDYVLKDLSKVGVQLRFDSFESMVACKILWEGQFLCGSGEVFDRVKRLVDEHGIAAKLAELERQAREHREQAEAALLRAGPGLGDSESLHLFYTREESEEIF
jgi:hypothetical protein